MCCRDTKSIGQWRAVVCRANAYAKLRFSYEMGKPLGGMYYERLRYSVAVAWGKWLCEDGGHLSDGFVHLSDALVQAYEGVRQKLL